MGSNSSIFKAVESISGIGMLYTVPRTVIQMALGDGTTAISTAHNLFKEIVHDGTSLLISSKIENPILGPFIPDISGPLLVYVSENQNDPSTTKTPPPKSAESNQIVLCIAKHLLNHNISFQASCAILVYNQNLNLTENIDKVMTYITYHTSALNYFGKFDYLPYAADENAFCTFPNGLGHNKDFWSHGTWTKDAKGIEKSPINSVVKLVEYSQDLNFPTFKTSGEYYYYEGKVDLAQKTLHLKMFNPDKCCVSNLTLTLHAITSHII